VKHAIGLPGYIELLYRCKRSLRAETFEHNTEMNTRYKWTRQAND